MATPIPVNHARFTIDEIVRATGGTPIGPSVTGDVTGVVTDSRVVTAGSLFVAIQGELIDAHRFLPDVERAGARLALVRAGAVVSPTLSAIAVPDTTRALGELARFHRLRWGKQLVAITGSAGKTTTKELTAAALGGVEGRVLKTSGNLNNAIGVPMTLLQLGSEHDVAVVEVGTSARGEIAWLAEIARPNVAVVTEVAAAHTAGLGLGTVADVAQEKTDLLRALGADGVAIWNADNVALSEAVVGVKAKQLRFGTGGTVDLQLLSHSVTSELRERCVFVSRSSGARSDVSLGLFGVAAALDAAAALLVVRALRGEAALDMAGQRLAEVLPTPGRMCPVVADNHVLLLDDTYNANPISCERSMRTAVALAAARGGRAIVVLGDMKELGAESVSQHRHLGRIAVELELAAFVGCGAEMAEACDAAITDSARHRLPTPTRVMHVIDPLEAVPIVRAQVEPNDVVLIKGSRSMAMERVLRALSPVGVPV
jgi:UDP-N-acetylmuramoyl-tripeptide--D-alanyl-D-alanine ligase